MSEESKTMNKYQQREEGNSVTTGQITVLLFIAALFGCILPAFLRIGTWLSRRRDRRAAKALEAMRYVDLRVSGNRK